MLLLTTTYEVGFFDSSTENRIARSQALVDAVMQSCIGRVPTWGETRPCGAGEPHILCAKAR